MNEKRCVQLVLLKESECHVSMRKFMHVKQRVLPERRANSQPASLNLAPTLPV